MRDELYEKRLEKQFSAESVVTNLLRVGLALTLHELLKLQVLKVRDAHSFGFDEDQDRELFESQVLVLDPQSRVFPACMRWLVDGEALTDGDVATLNALQAYRHSMAHESTAVVIDPEFPIDDELIEHGKLVLEKLALFWARFWIDVGDEHDNDTIPDEDIQVPAVQVFDHVFRIAQATKDSI